MKEIISAIAMRNMAHTNINEDNVNRMIESINEQIKNAADEGKMQEKIYIKESDYSGCFLLYKPFISEQLDKAGYKYRYPRDWTIEAYWG